MKERVTKFDLEAAFQALDSIEVPKVSGIKANRLNLSESVKRVDRTSLLVEDYYDLSNKEDVDQASAERENEIAKAKLNRIEKIVDLDADSPDELQPSYVGKTIIQCPQCMTLFYKNPEDVEADTEDPTLVNIGEVCQHCGNDDGYTLIGKVAEEEIPMESEDQENSTEEPSEDSEISGANDEENFEEPNLDDFNKDLELERVDTEESDEESKENTEEEPLESESKEEPEEEKPEEEKTKKESLHQYKKSRVSESYLVEENITTPSKSEINSLLNSEEYDTPVSDSEVRRYLSAGIPDNVVDDQDENNLESSTVEELHESSINRHISKYLTEVYSNVLNFKSTDCTFIGNKIIIEGIINFNSGKQKSTKFIFNKVKNKNILEGYNKDFTKNKAFKLKYIVENKGSILRTINFAYKYSVNGALVEGYTTKK